MTAAAAPLTLTGTTSTVYSTAGTTIFTTSVYVLNSIIYGFDSKGVQTSTSLGAALAPGAIGIPTGVIFPSPILSSPAATITSSASQPTSTPAITSVSSFTASSSADSFTTSSSINSDTSQSTEFPPSTTSVAPSSSQTSPTPPTGVSRTSLIATATVLGVLLAIAIIALLFFLFRKRRNAYTRQESSESMVELKGSPDREVSDLKATIAGLEKSLENRDATIRRTQAAALKNGHSFGDSSLGDAEIRDRFTALSHAINDWVLTYFKGIRLDNVQNPDVAEALRKSVPNYNRLLEDPRTKYLVLRAVISDIIAEAFSNGQFIGSAAYGELKRGLDVNAGGPESREWEAMTVALLEKSPRAQEQRKSAVEAVVRKIDYISSKLAGLDFSEQRTAQLRVSIDNAAHLATAVAKQPALYYLAIEQPGATFNGETMEDALQESNAYSLGGRKIQGTVFPVVLKRNVSEGSAQGKILCVRRAQIIA